MDSRILIQSASKHYAAFRYPPVMLHIKSDQDWLTGLRDIQVQKCTIFVIQGQVTPKLVVWSGPKQTHLSFYACPGYQQLWWWFDKKMNEVAWRQHFPIISLWEIFLKPKDS